MPNPVELKVLTIGIRGSHPGCGKDTVADMITKKLRDKGYAVRSAKFATALRLCIEGLTGIPVAETETLEGKKRFLPEYGKTVGQLLQTVGSLIREGLGNPNVWVDALFRQFGSTDIVVISDVRYKNENTAVEERNGFTLHVASTCYGNAEHMAGRSKDHSSERDLDDVPAKYVIHNNGTLEELSQQVDQFMEVIVFPGGSTQVI